MLARLERFDRLIAESEARIAERRILIVIAEAGGRDTTTAKRALEAFKGILAEYRRARMVTDEFCQRIDGTPRQTRPHRTETSS